MIGCQNVDDQNFNSLEHGGRTMHNLLRKGFIKSRSKYGSSQLVKVRAEDGSGLHNLFDYCQHMIELMTYKIRNR